MMLTILLFSLTALVGPCIRWLTWPPSLFEQDTSAAVNSFISDLVFLLWPTQSLAVIEVNSGPLLAAIAAVSANILLFAMGGVFAFTLRKTRFGLPALYLIVTTMLVFFALWGAGFSVEYINFFALTVALLLYAIPFRLTSRFRS